MRGSGLQWVDAMRSGNLSKAWEITDYLEADRREREKRGSFRWNPDFLLWNGAPMEGRSVVVFCNHGLGDTLQFARFLPRLGRIAREVTLLAQPPLVELLAGMPGFGRVMNGWEKSAAKYADDSPGTVQVEVMELAYALRATLCELSRAVPYLCKRSVWERSNLRIRGLDRALVHIGLYWQASNWDQTRSIPVQEWRPLGRLRNVKYYSLQPWGSARGNLPLSVVPLEQQTGAIADLASAILQLDLIVTVDSMVAHLAGALGRPVWLLLKPDADWRWMENRNDSPWYPSMRLFRRKSTGSWTGVLEEVATALGGFVPDKASLSRRHEGTQGRAQAKAGDTHEFAL